LIALTGEVHDSFRGLAGEFYNLAGIYRQKTLDIIKEIGPQVDNWFRISLEIIFALYQMVYERIDVSRGMLTTEELTPAPAQTRERVYETIMRFEV